MIDVVTPTFTLGFWGWWSLLGVSQKTLVAISETMWQHVELEVEEEEGAESATRVRPFVPLHGGNRCAPKLPSSPSFYSLNLSVAGDSRV